MRCVVWGGRDDCHIDGTVSSHESVVLGVWGERRRDARNRRGEITRWCRASCRGTVFDICIRGETLQNYNTRLRDGRPPRRHDRRGTIQTVSKCRAAESLISQKRAASEVSAPTATPSSTCTPLANLTSFALMLVLPLAAPPPLHA